jgi:hypothetical protein
MNLKNGIKKRFAFWQNVFYHCINLKINLY